MLQSRAARAAGLYYLEHESMELKTGDKVWKVYGSPVRLHVCMSRYRHLTSYRLHHDICQGLFNTRLTWKQRVRWPRPLSSALVVED